MENAACRAELTVPGDVIYLRPVRAFARALAENIGFSGQKVNDIELAVDEIFSNAVEHGSGGVFSQVGITFLLNEDSLRIVISDTGQGKNANSGWCEAWAKAIKKNTSPGTERGHGLLLAHGLADEMIMESNPAGGVDVHLIVHRRA